jgi:hypothetical protein
MKCPNCGEEMEEGYVTLDGEGTALCWSKVKPSVPRIVWKEKETLLRSSIFHLNEEHWLRKGYRCANCKLVTFVYT